MKRKNRLPSFQASERGEESERFLVRLRSHARSGAEQMSTAKRWEPHVRRLSANTPGASPGRWYICIDH